MPEKGAEWIKNLIEGSVEDCQKKLRDLPPESPEYFRVEGRLEAFQDLLELIKRKEELV